ncbi:hypothetical protein Lpar_1932 [Legionella parisiensis]|uniref:Uncharacterized protein n=1 Tax=Legionella parisiensis TaxID=45071 RepID=A0A1E5JLD7_9GAMM|nr:hypothetical protein Lpar_1932 [Legionella parisiensis]OEH45339.1 hypothetical protein lpari_03673 [Legionella parisiensis]STX76992.1 Uncharacterised protein [Legionella parisiensis]
MNKLIKKLLIICNRTVLSLLHTKSLSRYMDTPAVSHRSPGNKSQMLFIYCFTKETRNVRFLS